MEKEKTIKKSIKKRGVKIVSIVMATVLALSGVILFLNRGLVAEALFNPEDGVLYSDFKAKNTVDDSVLFIGTYIVHKDALTDKLYEQAMTSASDSGQNDIYYKSELSDGKWFNVGDIDNGINGIASEGVPEPEENIDPLYVTFYAGADGILRDAKSMMAVNPFDIPDPYDLSKLPELQGLWLQYAMSETATSVSQEDFLKNRNSSESGNLRSDVYYYQLLSTFFSLGPELKDERTDKCDEQLKTLNSLYIKLKAEEKEDEAETVYHLMDMVDSKRRAIVMEKLAEIDDNLLNMLYTLSTGTYYTTNGNFKDSSSEEKQSEEKYITQLQDSLHRDDTSSSLVLSNLLMNSVFSSWFGRLGIVQSSNGWWTVLDNEESDRQKKHEEANKDNDDYVYDKTPQEHPFNADSALLDAIGDAMSQCGESYSKYSAKCLEDKDDVLGHAEYEYASAVLENSTADTLGGPVTYLTHVMKIRDNQVADAKGELELLLSSLIGACSSRYTSKSTSGVNSEYASLASQNAKQSSLDDQKSDLEAERSMLQFLIDGVRQRDTAANALAYVYDRITWTENLKTQIGSDDFKPYATSSVEAHIVWLKEEAQRIIDSDESLKSDADRLRDKKEDLQRKRDAALDDNDLAGAAAYDAMIAAVDQDLAALDGDGSGNGNGSGSGKGGSGSMADSLLDKAMDKLADDANADLSGIADALAAAGEDDKLKDLMDKAAASGASASTLKGIKNAMDSGDGSGSGSGNGLDVDGLLSQLEALFGKSLDEMDDRELAIATATLSQLARSGIAPARELKSQVLSRLIASNNKFVYNQYGSDKTVEYVNLRTLSLITAYRYFYDETKATGTVTKGSTVYIFTRGSDQMHNGSIESDPEQLTDSAVFEGDLYIGETDSDRYFGCNAEYVFESDRAICLTGPMQAAVAEYVKSLSAFFAG